MSRSPIVRHGLAAPVLAFVATLLLGGCAATPGASRSLSTLPPKKFAQLPALQAPLDSAHLDHALLAAALFHETNRIRRDYGRRPFRWLAQLDEAADLQANSIALDQTVSHTNLLPALLTINDRLNRVGLSPGPASENTAALPLLDIDSAHGIQLTRQEDQFIATDSVTGRTAEPRTYASFAVAAVQAWMDSPGHRANILDRNMDSLGCSGRGMKRIASVEMIACVQVFYSSPHSRPR